MFTAENEVRLEKKGQRHRALKTSLYISVTTLTHTYISLTLNVQTLNEPRASPQYVMPQSTKQAITRNVQTLR